MPTPIGYFPYAFAITGDTTPVPTTIPVNNAVNYQTGYPSVYELNLLTDPLALPIGRTTMNQLFFDITSQLQQYSQYGVPPFITAAQNLMTPFPYPIYARCGYAPSGPSSYKIYENQVASNTATPGTDNSWLVISGDATGVITGTIVDYAGVVVPNGYLPCDNSAVSRTTYAPLLAVISQIQTGTTTVSLNTVSGLTSTAQMYVGMNIESANFATGTTIASIVDANNITITPVATGSGSTPIQFFNWGNGDGSTTFNTPDLRRSTTIGQGGSLTNYATGGVNGTVVGVEGGQERHTMTTAELVAHVHAAIPRTMVAGAASGALGGGGNIGEQTLNTGSTGSTTPFNLMQVSAVVYKIIKT